jgi:hypothetical protein
MEKSVKIPEPHEWKVGGCGYDDERGVSFVKIHFFKTLTRDRAEEIAHQLQALVDKNT